jgi:hypothetical protein
MIALLALAAASKAILYDTLDPDCFWHLRVAEQLQRDGIEPLVDQMSFASIKTPWTPYSWLAELAMKAIWDFGGYRAAVLTQALLMAAFVTFVAAGAHELSNRSNPVAVVISTAFAMYFSLPYLSFRPVTAALVMLSVCTWLLLRDRRLNQQGRAVWWIVPLTVLIANCHFFSVLVPLFVGALLVGALWERVSVKRYILLLVATIAACAATPMLPGMLRSIWDYQFADPMLDAGIIAEFRPVWSGSLGGLSAALLMSWIVLLWARRTQLRTGEMVWAMGLLVLVLRLGRFAPVFAPIGAAVLAGCLPRFGGAALRRPAARVATACVLLGAVIRLSLAFPKSDMPLDSWLNRHGPDTPGYPCAAADYVAAQVPPGRIINEFTWGGFLGWRLGDSYPILLDGRTQVYSPDFWRSVYGVLPGQVREILHYSNARAAILPATRSRFHDVLLSLGWSCAYRDDRAVVLIPPDPNLLNTSIDE